MEKLVNILILLLFIISGCTTPTKKNPHQIFYSNKNDTVLLFYNGSNDLLYIHGPSGKGKCLIANEEQPYIRDVVNDTIFIWYDYMHNIHERDTILSGFIKYINDSDCEFIVKGEYNYFYNGNAIGSIDRIVWDKDYSYFIDSVVHRQDTVSFYRESSIIYSANQRDVNYDNRKKRWEVFYLDSVIRDDLVYKIKKSILFLHR